MANSMGVASAKPLSGNQVSGIARYLLQENLLVVSEVFSLLKVCNNIVCSPCAAEYLQQWLLKREPWFRNAGVSDIPWLHRQYRGSLLQVEFVRILQEYVPLAVIAGSFPLAHELWQQQQQQHGQQQWQQQQQQHEQNLRQGPMFQPSDIDIFVFAEGDVDSVEEVYISHVVARLQGSVRVVRNNYMWHASFLSDDGSASEDEQRQDEQRRQRARQTPNVVRREIKAWVADYARLPRSEWSWLAGRAACEIRSTIRSEIYIWRAVIFPHDSAILLTASCRRMCSA